MTGTNLIDTNRELRVGDRVIDGNSTAEVVTVQDFEIQVEYTNGDRIWLQDNRFQWNERDGEWRVV
jgi:hypothetical protein